MKQRIKLQRGRKPFAQRYDLQFAEHEGMMHITTLRPLSVHLPQKTDRAERFPSLSPWAAPWSRTEDSIFRLIDEQRGRDRIAFLLSNPLTLVEDMLTRFLLNGLIAFVRDDVTIVSISSMIIELLLAGVNIAPLVHQIDQRYRRVVKVHYALLRHALLETLAYSFRRQKDDPVAWLHAFDILVREMRCGRQSFSQQCRRFLKAVHGE